MQTALFRRFEVSQRIPTVTEQLPTRSSCIAAQRSAAWTYSEGGAVIRCSGSDRIDLLHRMTTNDLTKLLPDHGIQTVIVNEKARILDVVMVMQADEYAYLLGSSGMSSSVITWLKKYIITDDVRLQDLTEQHACIEIMGPRSAEIVEGLMSVDCGRWSLGQWTSIELDGQQVKVVRMPSSCELSFWIVGDREALAHIAAVLRENATDIPELDAVDVAYLRILSGMGAHDHEWSEAYNPLEAGLLHLTSFTKGCYIGQEVIARLDSYNKVKQRIMGIVAAQEVHEGDVLQIDSSPVGVITSVTRSCDGASWLALGYVRGEHAVTNSPIGVRSGDVAFEATQYLPPLQDASCQ